MIRSTDENKQLTEAKGIEVQEAKEALYSKLETVGNLVHDSVPVSNDEVRAFFFFSSLIAVVLFDAMWKDLEIVLVFLLFLQENNAVVRSWGEKRVEGTFRNHVELVQLLEIADMTKGT